MRGNMSLWNVQGPLLHSGDTLVHCILTVDYTITTGEAWSARCLLHALWPLYNKYETCIDRMLKQCWAIVYDPGPTLLARVFLLNEVAC